MNLFLQGESGIGKSSLLLELLDPITDITAGFITQRLIKNGKTIGFRAVNISGTFVPLEINYKKELDGVFMLNGKTNISVLEKVIFQVEQDIQKDNIRLIILDEIGGMELTSQIFMESLQRIFSRGLQCVGVMKSRGNLMHTVSTLGLGQEYLMLHDGIENYIMSRGDLITVTKDELSNAKEALIEFINKNNFDNVNIEERG